MSLGLMLAIMNSPPLEFILSLLALLFGLPTSGYPGGRCVTAWAVFRVFSLRVKWLAALFADNHVGMGSVKRYPDQQILQGPVKRFETGVFQHFLFSFNVQRDFQLPLCVALHQSIVSFGYPLKRE